MLAFQIILLVIAICLFLFAAYQLYLTVEENIRLTKLHLETQNGIQNSDFELNTNVPSTENG